MTIHHDTTGRVLTPAGVHLGNLYHCRYSVPGAGCRCYWAWYPAGPVFQVVEFEAGSEAEALAVVAGWVGGGG